MRVAICTYWYPPTRTIASLRMAKFAKYLPDFGWEPHVFTVAPRTDRYTAAGELDDAVNPEHVHRIPDPSVHVWVDRLAGVVRRGGTTSTGSPPAASRSSRPSRPSSVRRLAYRCYRDLVCVPDEAWPWLCHYRKVRDAAAKASVDVVFSSSPPATAHVLARRLARDLGKPWVADLRDPWADMHTVDRSSVRRWLDQRLERRTLCDAAALTTVSGTMATRFAADYHVPVHVIMNGYDEADVPADVETIAPEAERLAFVYTGMLYEGRRTPLPLFNALRQLHRRGEVDLSRIVVRLYGRNLDIAERELRDFPELTASVELLGEVGYRESLIAQRRATVLLLLEWADPRAAGVVTGKIFEYLSAARPILAIGPHGGEIERVLEMTGRGVLAATDDELEAAVLASYRRFCATGPEKVESMTMSLNLFSRKALAGNLAEVFTAVLRANKAQGRAAAHAAHEGAC